MHTRERLLESKLPPDNNHESQEFILVRHGKDDESYIDGSFDNGLLEEGVENIKELTEEVARYFYGTNIYSNIRILHSSKRRAYQTGVIMHQYLSSGGIAVSRKNIDELRELYQGEMVLDKEQTLEERAALLQRAWTAYSSAVETYDLAYRFGDPCTVDGEDTYLTDQFLSYGENQYEFTSRVYGFVRDMMQYDFDTSLPVVVAHRATVTKVQRIIGACSIYAHSAETIRPGHLRFIERTAERTKVDHAQGVILPMRNRRFARNIIERELTYLNASMNSDE